MNENPTGQQANNGVGNVGQAMEEADRMGYTPLKLGKPEQYLSRERHARTLPEICGISPMWRWNSG